MNLSTLLKKRQSNKVEMRRLRTLPLMKLLFSVFLIISVDSHFVKAQGTSNIPSNLFETIPDDLSDDETYINKREANMLDVPSTLFANTNSLSTARPSDVFLSSDGVCSEFLTSHDYNDVLSLKFVVTATDDSLNEALLHAEVIYEGQGYVALGFSTAGGMLNSLAVIGLPDELKVAKYNLGGYGINMVTELDKSQQTLNDTSIEQNSTHTVLRFTKYLDEPNEIPINLTEPNDFIVAAGSSGDSLGYHSYRGSFQFPPPVPCIVPFSTDDQLLFGPYLATEHYNMYSEPDWTMIPGCTVSYDHDLGGEVVYCSMSYVCMKDGSCVENVQLHSTITWNQTNTYACYSFYEGGFEEICFSISHSDYSDYTWSNSGSPMCNVTYGGNPCDCRICDHGYNPTLYHDCSDYKEEAVSEDCYNVDTLFMEVDTVDGFPVGDRPVYGPHMPPEHNYNMYSQPDWSMIPGCGVSYSVGEEVHCRFAQVCMYDGSCVEDMYLQLNITWQRQEKLACYTNTTWGFDPICFSYIHDDYSSPMCNVTYGGYGGNPCDCGICGDGVSLYHDCSAYNKDAIKSECYNIEMLFMEVNTVDGLPIGHQPVYDVPPTHDYVDMHYPPDWSMLPGCSFSYYDMSEVVHCSFYHVCMRNGGCIDYFEFHLIMTWYHTDTYGCYTDYERGFEQICFAIFHYGSSSSDPYNSTSPASCNVTYGGNPCECNICDYGYNPTISYDCSEYNEEAIRYDCYNVDTFFMEVEMVDGFPIGHQPVYGPHIPEHHYMNMNYPLDWSMIPGCSFSYYDMREELHCSLGHVCFYDGSCSEHFEFHLIMTSYYTDTYACYKDYEKDFQELCFSIHHSASNNSNSYNTSMLPMCSVTYDGNPCECKICDNGHNPTLYHDCSKYDEEAIAIDCYNVDTLFMEVDMIDGVPIGHHEPMYGPHKPPEHHYENMYYPPDWSMIPFCEVSSYEESVHCSWGDVCMHDGRCVEHVEMYVKPGWNDTNWYACYTEYGSSQQLCFEIFHNECRVTYGENPCECQVCDHGYNSTLYHDCSDYNYEAVARECFSIETLFMEIESVFGIPIGHHQVTHGPYMPPEDHYMHSRPDWSTIPGCGISYYIREEVGCSFHEVCGYDGDCVEDVHMHMSMTWNRTDTFACYTDNGNGFEEICFAIFQSDSSNYSNEYYTHIGSPVCNVTYSGSPCKCHICDYGHSPTISHDCSDYNEAAIASDCYNMDTLFMKIEKVDGIPIAHNHHANIYYHPEWPIIPSCVASHNYMGEEVGCSFTHLCMYDGICLEDVYLQLNMTWHHSEKVACYTNMTGNFERICFSITNSDHEHFGSPVCNVTYGGNPCGCEVCPDGLSLYYDCSDYNKDAVERECYNIETLFMEVDMVNVYGPPEHHHVNVYYPPDWSMIPGCSVSYQTEEEVHCSFGHVCMYDGSCVEDVELHLIMTWNHTDTFLCYTDYERGFDEICFSIYHNASNYTNQRITTMSPMCDVTYGGNPCGCKICHDGYNPTMHHDCSYYNTEAIARDCYNIDTLFMEVLIVDGIPVDHQPMYGPHMQQQPQHHYPDWSMLRDCDISYSMAETGQEVYCAFDRVCMYDGTCVEDVQLHLNATWNQTDTHGCYTQKENGYDEICFSIFHNNSSNYFGSNTTNFGSPMCYVTYGGNPCQCRICDHGPNPSLHHDCSDYNTEAVANECYNIDILFMNVYTINGNSLDEVYNQQHNMYHPPDPFYGDDDYYHNDDFYYEDEDFAYNHNEDYMNYHPEYIDRMYLLFHVCAESNGGAGMEAMFLSTEADFDCKFDKICLLDESCYEHVYFHLKINSNQAAEITICYTYEEKGFEEICFSLIEPDYGNSEQPVCDVTYGDEGPCDCYFCNADGNPSVFYDCSDYEIDAMSSKCYEFEELLSNIATIDGKSIDEIIQSVTLPPFPSPPHGDMYNQWDDDAFYDHHHGDHDHNHNGDYMYNEPEDIVSLLLQVCAPGISEEALFSPGTDFKCKLEEVCLLDGSCYNDILFHLKIGFYDQGAEINLCYTEKGFEEICFSLGVADVTTGDAPVCNVTYGDEGPCDCYFCNPGGEPSLFYDCSNYEIDVMSSRCYYVEDLVRNVATIGGRPIEDIIRDRNPFVPSYVPVPSPVNVGNPYVSNPSEEWSPTVHPQHFSNDDILAMLASFEALMIEANFGTSFPGSNLWFDDEGNLDLCMFIRGIIRRVPQAAEMLRYCRCHSGDVAPHNGHLTCRIDDFSNSRVFQEFADLEGLREVEFNTTLEHFDGDGLISLNSSLCGTYDPLAVGEICIQVNTSAHVGQLADGESDSLDIHEWSVACNVSAAGESCQRCEICSEGFGLDLNCTNNALDFSTEGCVGIGDFLFAVEDPGDYDGQTDGSNMNPPMEEWPTMSHPPHVDTNDIFEMFANFEEALLEGNFDLNFPGSIEGDFDLCAFIRINLNVIPGAGEVFRYCQCHSGRNFPHNGQLTCHVDDFNDVFHDFVEFYEELPEVGNVRDVKFIATVQHSDAEGLLSLNSSLCGTYEPASVGEICIQVYTSTGAGESENYLANVDEDFVVCNVWAGGQMCRRCEICSGGFGLDLDCRNNDLNFTTDGCRPMNEFLYAMENQGNEEGHMQDIMYEMADNLEPSTGSQAQAFLDSGAARFIIDTPFIVDIRAGEMQENLNVASRAYHHFISRLMDEMMSMSEQDFSHDIEMMSIGENLFRQGDGKGGQRQRRTSKEGKEQQQRRRSLTVMEDPLRVPVVREFIDCPNFATAEFTKCKLALANYTILVKNEDIEMTRESFTAATEFAIEKGILQESLFRVDGKNTMLIKGTPEHVESEHGLLPDNAAMVGIDFSFNVDYWVGDDPHAVSVVVEAVLEYVPQQLGTLDIEASVSISTIQEPGQRRRLNIALEHDSVEVFEIVPCPDFSCTTVFANYEVRVMDEDPGEIEEILVEATQTGAIDGTLEEIVREIDPLSTILLSEPTETLPPISPATFPPESLSFFENSDPQTNPPSEVSAAEQSEESTQSSDDVMAVSEENEADRAASAASTTEPQANGTDVDEINADSATTPEDDETGMNARDMNVTTTPPRKGSDDDQTSTSAETNGTDTSVTENLSTASQSSDTDGLTESVTITSTFHVASAVELENVVEDIKASFREYVATYVSPLAGSSQGQQQRRRMLRLESQHLYADEIVVRRLAETINEESITVQTLYPCPDSVTRLPFCQTMEGQYDVVVSNEDSEDVHSRYSDATQMGVENGIFETLLKERNSRLVLLPSASESTVEPNGTTPPEQTQTELPGATEPPKTTGPPAIQSARSQGHESQVTGQRAQDENDPWRWYYVAAAVLGGMLVGFLVGWLIRKFCCRKKKDAKEHTEEEEDRENSERDTEKAIDRSFLEGKSTKGAEAASNCGDSRSNTNSASDSDLLDSDSEYSNDSCSTTESEEERRERYKEKITPIIEEYFPDKLDELQATLLEFKGREDEVLEAVKARANKERKNHYRESVEELIRTYFPEKENDNIDDLMAKWRGKEPALVSALKWKGLVNQRKKEKEARKKNVFEDKGTTVSDDEPDSYLSEDEGGTLKYHSDESEDEGSILDRATDDGGGIRDNDTFYPSEMESMEQEYEGNYRQEIEKLLNEHYPEKVDYMDEMLEEFEGNEDELLTALRMRANQI